MLEVRIDLQRFQELQYLIQAFPAERIAIHRELDLLELLGGGGRLPAKAIRWKTDRPAKDHGDEHLGYLQG